MPQKKHKPEEIVAKLRQVDVLLSQGRAVAEAIRTISVTPFTYYRWRKEFGGLKGDQRGGSVCLNTSRGVSKWLGRSFQAAAGIGVGTVVYA